MLKLLVVLLFATALGAKYKCNYETASQLFKRPTYNFSVKLLDRVTQETNRHFVFSPISTWLQLLALSEGAVGKTLEEIFNVTGQYTPKCFRQKFRILLNKMDRRLNSKTKRSNLMVIDKLLAVKPSFKRDVQMLNSAEVLLLDFADPYKAADTVNRHISSATNGFINKVLYPADFNSTVLLTADSTYYRSNWKVPFDPVFTTTESFYSDFGSKLGEVYMMTRIDNFNLTTVPYLEVRVLELPCGFDDRVSMLIFLPYKNNSIRNIFYDLENTRLRAIFNNFKKEKPKLAKVKLPKFKISTELDNIPELLFDMGLKRIFYPNFAELNGISSFKVLLSFMTQIADIEVTEEGVKAYASADIKIPDTIPNEFIVNKPFAFMLVDKVTEIILFSGMYSFPENFEG